VPDDKPDLATFKIDPDDKSWADLEQLRLKQPGQGKQTQAALFKRLRAAYVSQNTPTSGELTKTSTVRGSHLDSDVLEIANRIKRTDIPWVWKLLRVLDSGKKDFEHAVKSNLDVFAGYCDVDLPANGDASDTAQGTASKRSARSGSTRKTG